MITCDSNSQIWKQFLVISEVLRDVIRLELIDNFFVGSITSLEKCNVLN
jgi:hypothetical protein